MKRSVCFLSVLCLLLFTRCATVSVDRPRLASIKKVAVAGFSVQQQEPPGFQWNLGGSERSSGPMAGPNWKGSLPKASPHAEQLYGSLQKALRTQFKWKVSDPDAIAKNKFYAEFFQKTMKGIQSRPPLPGDMEALSVPQLTDAYPIERLSDSERVALMDALNVDAIAVATVVVTLEKGGGLKQLVGAGEYKPFSTLRFTLYDRKGPGPVWRDLAARGQADQGADHILGMTDKTLLLKKIQAATEVSYTALLSRFEKS